MAEIKVLFLLFIFAYISKTTNSFGIQINLAGKSKLKTIQASCVSKGDCGYGLQCIQFMCRCSNDDYWNSTNCETKLALYFKSTNYSTVTISQYNGTTFNFVSNIAVIEHPTYYIYVGDSLETNGLLAKYDQFGSYIDHISLDGVFGIQPINNTVLYVSVWLNKTLYAFDPNLNIINIQLLTNTTYEQSPRYLRYNPSNGILYLADPFSNYVIAYDSGFNLIESESLHLNQSPFGIDIYQSSSLGSLIIVTTTSNSIQILKQSDKTVYKILNSVCAVGFPFSIFVHQKSGYILVSCNSDNRIRLWLTDGINFVYTGKTLSIPHPTGVSFDSNGRLLVANFDAHSFSILTPP